MRQVQDPQALKVRYAFDLRDLVVVQVQNLQSGKLVDAPDLADQVLRQEQHLQRQYGQILHLSYLVVVEVDIQEVRQRNKILDLRNPIVLECEHLEFLLPLQQRNMIQL